MLLNVFRLLLNNNGKNTANAKEIVVFLTLDKNYASEDIPMGIRFVRSRISPSHEPHEILGQKITDDLIDLMIWNSNLSAFFLPILFRIGDNISSFVLHSNPRKVCH